MHIVAIGDVGVLDDMVHIGDEAMFEELVLQMRQRGVDRVTGISANPAETAARYGIEAIARIGFGFTGPDSRQQMTARMERVLRAAAAGTDTAGATDAAASQRADVLSADDPAGAVIAAIRAADAVAICGGGNMASTWPLHIFERATIAEIARLSGTPLVVSGQTIGPVLTAEDAAQVAALLSSAALVGLRERPSYDLCSVLGVPPGILNHTVDDASFLASDPVAAADAVAAGADALAGPYCLVTFSTHTGQTERADFAAAAARLLDDIAATTGLPIVFLAHFGSLHAGEVRGDSVVHALVAEQMTSGPVRVVTPTDAAAAARLARGASLLVSSRYHPAVFGVSAGVPTLGIAVDEYTTTKLTGALGNFGQRAVVSDAGLLAGHATQLARTLWDERDAIRSVGREHAAENRAASAVWWDRVAAACAPAGADTGEHEAPLG